MDSVHLHWIRITSGEARSVSGLPGLGTYRCPNVFGVGAVLPTSPRGGVGSGDPWFQFMKCVILLNSNLLSNSFVLILLSFFPSFPFSSLFLLFSQHSPWEDPRFCDEFRSFTPDPESTTQRKPELRRGCPRRDKGRLHMSGIAHTPLIHG